MQLKWVVRKFIPDAQLQSAREPSDSQIPPYEGRANAFSSW